MLLADFGSRDVCIGRHDSTNLAPRPGELDTERVPGPVDQTSSSKDRRVVRPADQGRLTDMDQRATDAPQHMRALDQANRVRLARAGLKREIADGSRTVSEVVIAADWESASMTIADLLMSQHRWGRTRCRRFLASVPMIETKTIGSMTERQRRQLAARLNGEPVSDPFGQRLAVAGAA